VLITDPGPSGGEDETGEVSRDGLQETEGGDGDTAATTLPGRCGCQSLVLAN